MNRRPAQTALSAIANRASELGDTLNKQLKSPTQTNRPRTLHIDNDVNASEDKLVTDDPTQVNICCLFVFLNALIKSFINF